MSTFIYNNYENRATIASLIHSYIHSIPLLSYQIMVGITTLDSILYSDETRATIINILNEDERKIIGNDLQNSDRTRQYIYRFFIKGSNSIVLLQYFLYNKYEELLKRPKFFKSDWDTAIIINPELSDSIFLKIKEVFIPIIQKFMADLTHKFEQSPEYLMGDPITNAISNVNSHIQLKQEYEEFRKYPMIWDRKKRTKLRILNASNKGVQLESGAGFFISSNRDGGKDFKNTTSIPKFYLGRIMLNIKASRNIHIPVEILDITIEYKNEDLQIAWDSHSEYNVQFDEVNARVISPISLYIDWKKCIYDARDCVNTRKQRKINKRLDRLQQILNKLIIPYKNKNSGIQVNLSRNHTKSHNFVRNTMRNLQREIDEYSFDR